MIVSVQASLRDFVKYKFANVSRGFDFGFLNLVDKPD